MATERPVVNATPGTPIRSETQRQAEAIRANLGTDDVPLPPLEEKSDSREDRFTDIEMSQEEREGRERMAAFLALPKEQQTARIATVLDRGVVYDRLRVDCPADLHYEWVRNDPLDIDRMRTLGFWVDDTYASKRALHSDGSSSNIVGDVICMMTMKENKKMIDRVRAEAQLRSQRKPKQAIEETEERGMVPDEIPVFSESSSRSITADDVRAALSRTDGQTRVQRG